MSDEFDPWGLSSGNLLDDADITITEAEFGFDDNYNNGESLVLKLEATTDDDDMPTTTIMLPCGNGWEPGNRGATAKREDGKDKNFNKQSGIGLWITSAIEAGAGDVLQDRGTSFDAEVWPGLSFHVKRKAFNYGGEIGEKERLLITEFKGDGKEGKGKAAAKEKATKPEPEAKAESTSSGGTSGGGVKGALRVKLMKAAKEADTHDDFIEKAFELDGVEGNADAEAVIMDPDGLYAEVKAEG